MTRMTTLLRRMIDAGTTTVAFGAYDAYSALLLERSGFTAAYMSGYLTSASMLGMPDMGLMTATERLSIAREMTRRVDIPVVADMEQGYGNALNVHRSLQQFEASGLAGIHIDDEVFPGKDQFFASSGPNPLVSIDEMCGKVAAAVEARTDPDFLIIARSDVLGSVREGTVPREELVREIVQRSNAYIEAGADMAFVYAANPEELEKYEREIDAPLAALIGFMAPMTLMDYESVGVSLVISTLPLLGGATLGINRALEAFKAEGTWSSMLEHMVTHDEIKETLSLEGYSDLLNAYKEGGPSDTSDQ